MLPTGALTGLLVAAVITYLIPNQYESQAVIELKPIHADEKRMLSPMDGEDETPVWLVDEIERLKSRKSLDEVIARLKLEKRWNLKIEEVREILNQRLQVYSMRGTNMISISMRHGNKVDAKNIALEIANLYIVCHDGAQSRESERQMQELNQAVNTQQEKVEALQQALNQLIKDSNQVGETYANTERELEMAQAVLQSLSLRRMGVTISAKIPYETASFHEMPQIANKPVFPNLRLNLILGAILGFFLSPVMTLVVIRFNRAALSQRAS